MAENADRKIIEILYSDQSGEMAKRRILPKRIYFGQAPWPSEEQWILEALDLEAQADQAFALKDIQAWLPTELQSSPF